MVLFAGLPRYEAAADDVPDFSRGFEMLRDLGLPSAEEAQPMLIRQGWGQTSHDNPTLWVWERPGTGDEPVLVLSQTLELPADHVPAGPAGMDAGHDADIHRMMMNHGSDRPAAAGIARLLRAPAPEQRISLEMTDQEMADAARKVIEALGDSQFDTWRIGETVELLSRSLLLAAQLDERGSTDAANGLAAAVLGTPAGAELVIGGAVTLLADTAYALALEEFFASGDQEAWRAALEGLLGRYSRGYANEAVVRMIADDAAAALEAAADQPDEAASLAQQWRAAPLDEAAREYLATAVAVPRQSWIGYSTVADEGAVPWILDPSLAEATDPLGQLLARGADALPVLLALTGDSSPTPNPADMTRASQGFFSSPQDAATRAFTLYNEAMPRPATVAELAAALVLAALPAGGERGRRAPRPGELEGLVSAWLAPLDPSDMAALAETYLNEGSDTQRVAAFSVMLRAPEPERIERIEEYLLELRPRRTAQPMLMNYLRSRGPDGAEFLDRYRALIEEEVSGADDSYFAEEWGLQRGLFRAAPSREIERQLTLLDNLVGDVDFAGLLDQATDMESFSRDYVTMLGDAAVRLAAEEAAGLWLNATLARESPGARLRMLGLGPRILSTHEPDDELRESWLRLLDDDSIHITPEEHGGDGEHGTSLAHAAAMVVLQLQEPDTYIDYGRFQRLSIVLGEEGMKDVMMARARRLLNGDAAGPWPDEDLPPPAEVAALIERLDALEPHEVAAAVEDLAVGEKLALMAHDEPLEAFDRASRLIGNLHLHEAHAALLPELADWPGKPLTLDMVESLITALQGEAGDAGGVMLDSNELPPGIAVFSDGNERETSGWAGQFGHPGVLVSFEIDDDQAEGSGMFVRLDEQEAGDLDEHLMEELGGAEADWRELAERVFATDNKGPLWLRISLMPMAPEEPGEP